MKKLKAIWHEIIERWFLLTFFAQRMERERLQVLAELIKRKNSLWKNIPMKPRTISEILKSKSTKQEIKDVIELSTPTKILQVDKETYKLLNVINKQKENGNSKENSDKESV